MTPPPEIIPLLLHIVSVFAVSDVLRNLIDNHIGQSSLVISNMQNLNGRVIENFASPSRAEMGQAPVKLTISPSSTFNLNWENQILASETFYNC